VDGDDYGGGADDAIHDYYFMQCFFFLSQKMLQHLKEKKDVGFFTSVSGLMQQCRYVLVYKHSVRLCVHVCLCISSLP
jgi:hypothetical protein